MNGVFAAVADPTRRAILEQLRQGAALSVKELSEPLPISRQAVTKHLDQLAASGLLRVEWHGRERRHRLEAAPLREVDAWLRPYAEFWDDRLGRLKEYVEGER